MNIYVKDTKKALIELDKWIADIDGVLHPDLLIKIEGLMAEADLLLTEFTSIEEDLNDAKRALEENNIEI